MQVLCAPLQYALLLSAVMSSVKDTAESVISAKRNAKSYTPNGQHLLRLKVTIPCAIIEEVQRVSVTYPRVSSTLVSLPQLTQSSFLLFSQIGKLFDFGLVEPVDNRVFARYNVYTLDLQTYLVTHCNDSVKEANCTFLLSLNPT